MALLVPPKPKELLSTVCTGVSIRCAASRSVAASGSMSVRLMFGATKPFCIIKIEYTASLEPAIQHSCPVIDFVELIHVWLFPNRRDRAKASCLSPCGVDVAWALT